MINRVHGRSVHSKIIFTGLNDHDSQLWLEDQFKTDADALNRPKCCNPTAQEGHSMRGFKHSFVGY